MPIKKYATKNSKKNIIHASISINILLHMEYGKVHI